MAVLKPRTRLIYFRVSEEEFQTFTGLCERHRTRSISELARQAMQRLMADPTVEYEWVNPHVERLTRLMIQVSNQLDQLIGTAPILETQDTCSKDPAERSYE